MSVDAITARLPEVAKDLKLNLSSLLRDETLSKVDLWGTVVASAITTRNDFLIDEFLDQAEQFLSQEELEAAKGAAYIMGMNNIYYRFGHLVSHPRYGELQAGLRMSIIGNHGVCKASFELWSLAASAITGCGVCVDSHEKMLREHGYTEDKILQAVRIASVIHGLSLAVK